MRYMLRRFLLMLVSLSISAAASADEQRIGSLVLSNAFVMETPVGAETAAISLVIYNTGNTADQLISAASTVATTATIGTASTEEDALDQESVEAIAIPAHGKVILNRQGLHVILTGLKRDLNRRDTFPVTFTFAKAGSVTVQVGVAWAMGPFE